MTDPRDLLDEWQRLAESAKPFRRHGGVDPAMVGMLASDLLALIAAVRAVLDLTHASDDGAEYEHDHHPVDGYDTCPAADSIRAAITDALGGES